MPGAYALFGAAVYVTDMTNSHLRFRAYPRLKEAREVRAGATRGNEGVTRLGCFFGMMLRVLYWMRTPAKLDDPIHLQAVYPGARALLEVLVDMTSGRVAEGGCPPPAPTDPDVRV
jgi:hypothetical protein